MSTKNIKEKYQEILDKEIKNLKQRKEIDGMINYYNSFGKMLSFDLSEFRKNKKVNLKNNQVYKIIDESLFISENDSIYCNSKLEAIKKYLEYRNNEQEIDHIGVIASFYEQAYNKTKDGYYLIKIAQEFLKSGYYIQAIKIAKKYLSVGIVYSNYAYTVIKAAEHKMVFSKSNECDLEEFKVELRAKLNGIASDLRIRNEVLYLNSVRAASSDQYQFKKKIRIYR